ncbi:hypothetical protein [uncultured Friedmanniella sp.]|uniref:hypothetical protein n=1 Tax=uncultured Friedmanniella sp. TaxID=335381 RepID=UPI0035C94AC7
MIADMTITLEGERGGISAQALQTALGASLQLVQEAAATLGVSTGQWNVAELSLGSVTFALENPAAPGAATLVRSGMELLARRTAIPPQWNQAMVRKARDLARLSGSGGVHGVSVTTPGDPLLRLTAEFAAHAEQAIQAREVSLGSVHGLVDKWEDRRTHQIGLSLDDGTTITATYPRDLAARILREALGHVIEARGEIRRNGEGQRVSLALHDFTVPAETVGVSLAAIAGLYHELGDAGLTSTDVLDHRE